MQQRAEAKELKKQKPPMMPLMQGVSLFGDGHTINGYFLMKRHLSFIKNVEFGRALAIDVVLLASSILAEPKQRLPEPGLLNSFLA